MAQVRLDCPICGTVVSDGDAPVPGDCPGCRASYVGGTEQPYGAVEAAMTALGVDGDPEAAARRVFDLDPESGIAITSDRRDGFYAWWVFIADPQAARALLAA